MPQTFSPNIGDDLAGFIGGIAVAEPAAAVAKRTSTAHDFRLQFNCKNGIHYVGQMRGRGKDRTAEKGNYKYLGNALVLAQERGGYYAIRYEEYIRIRHKCVYK